MSFQQGLSGLNATSRNPDVIDNNVANVKTAGFKHWQVRFADVVANSLSSSGMGVKVAAASHQFDQRSIIPICLPSLFPRVKRPLLRSAS